MPATTNFQFPYPAGTDTPDVPRDMQALATTLDSKLGSGNLHGSVLSTPSGATADVAWVGGNVVALLDRMTPAASCSLRSYGIPPQGAGTRLTIRSYQNTGPTITVKHNLAGGPGGSAPFFCRSSTPLDVILAWGDEIEFVYDAANVIWAEVGRNASDTWHYVGQAGQPPYENGCTAYDTGSLTYQGRFRKDTANVVHLSGLVKAPADGTTVFTLPVGYRPVNILHFPIVTNAAFGYAHVSYPTVGAVRINGAGVTAWASLDGIQFYAEN